MVNAEAGIKSNEQLRILNAQELSFEHTARMAATRFAGEVLLGSEVHIEDSQPYHSLHEAAMAAYEGDEQGLEMVRTNIMADVTERTIKVGFVTDKARLDIDSGGVLIQRGQSSRSIHANSLRRNKHNQVMLERTEAENRNNFRIEYLKREGLFEDYNMVVFSLAENMPECGFDTETMSCSIQVTGEDGRGLYLESAFVAGKQPGQKEFGKDAVIKLYKQWAGVDISGMSNAEILDTPLLVPKSLMPDGVVDMVKLYDFFAGNDKFFGMDRPKEDYVQFKQACRQRQESYASTVDQVTLEFMAQVPLLETKEAASELLDVLSEKYTVIKAVIDNSIDPLVFGRKSASYIYEARLHLQNGEINKLETSISLAQSTANSSSCAVAGKERADGDGEDKYGSLSFYCPNGHKNTRGTNELIPNCKYCGVSVKCAPDSSKNKDSGSKIEEWDKQIFKTANRQKSLPKRQSAPLT